jgi:hypothetical protein
VAVDVNAGDFATDYYVCEIPRARWGNTRMAWIPIDMLRGVGTTEEILRDDFEYTSLRSQLETLRRGVDEGRTDPGDADYQLRYLEDALENARTRVLNESAGFRRVGSTAGKSWQTVKAVRFTVRITRPTYLWLDEMTVFGGVGGSLQGEVRYRVTYSTAADHETNPGPASALVQVSRQGVALTAIPTSGDAQVTKRHIYRGSDALGGSFYRIHTLNDNSTTAWTDAVSDEQATNGARLRDDRDPPPAARGLAEFFNRLIAFNTDAFPNRFFWTRPNEPQYWPPTNWAEVGDRNSGIETVTAHGRMLIFYKAGSIHILAGDPEDRGALEEADNTVGALGPRAVSNAGDVDYFAGPDGIYEFNMRAPRKISQAVDPIFRGETVTIGPGATIAPLSSDTAARRRTVVTYAQGMLRVQYAEQGQSYPSAELIHNVETGDWAINKSNIAAGAGFRSMLYDPNENRLYCGARNGMYYLLDEGLTDAGAAINVVWQSKYFDLGEPDLGKLLEDLAAEFNTGGGSATLKAYLNDGASEVAIASMSNNGRVRRVFPLASGLGVTARNFSVRVEGAITSALSVYDLSLHYQLRPRLARSFDTGLVNLGDRWHKQVVQLELDIETTDTNHITYRIESDYPGTVVALRESDSKAVPSIGRHNPILITPATVIQGGLFRFVITRTSEFQVWGFRVKFMPYPAHVNGDVAGETWQTEVLTLE